MLKPCSKLTLPRCRRALQIRLEAAKTSTSKLNAYIARTSADGRMRDNLLYQGAGRTGRWAGKGAQLQNPTRGGVEQVEDLLAIIRNEASPDFIELFGPPLEVVSACLRPMLMAATEHELIGATTMRSRRAAPLGPPALSGCLHSPW
jgi:DNA polymerase